MPSRNRISCHAAVTPSEDVGACEAVRHHRERRGVMAASFENEERANDRRRHEAALLFELGLALKEPTCSACAVAASCLPLPPSRARRTGRGALEVRSSFSIVSCFSRAWSGRLFHRSSPGQLAVAVCVFSLVLRLIDVARHDSMCCPTPQLRPSSSSCLWLSSGILGFLPAPHAHIYGYVFVSVYLSRHKMPSCCSASPLPRSMEAGHFCADSSLQGQMHKPTDK